MNTIQDPRLCTEDAIYKKKKFSPPQVGIPLLLQKMVKMDKKQLERHVHKRKSLYRKCENMKVVAEKDISLERKCAKVICPRPITKLSRSLATFRNWQLAPNRYTIKGRDVADIVQKQTGKKGPFYSGTLRNNDSLYGHLKSSKPCGTPTFYGSPTMIDLLNRYYNKHKMKFSTAARYRKPHLRFMVKDVVLCWRNPNDPGPAHYFPKNHCLETNIHKPVKAKPITVFNFLPNSSVPSRETAFLKAIDAKTPGPGRYETVEITCPCQSKLIIEPTIWREIEIEKRKRFRHLKYKRIKEELYCPCSKVRNIKGHGHTSVFQSKTVRLIERMPFTKKSDRLEKLHHTAKYIQMIVNPPRIPISITRVDMTPKPVQLTFNSIIKPKMRCKLKVNKRIAFLSATPRFKDEESSTILRDSSKSKEMAKSRTGVRLKEKNLEPPRLIKMTPSKEDVFKRLQQLPSRFQQKQITTREKVFTFSPIPAPQLLLKDSDVITREPVAHYYQTPLKIDDFLKDEYRKTISEVKTKSKDTIENIHEEIDI